jgi:hypothetical protein
MDDQEGFEDDAYGNEDDEEVKETVKKASSRPEDEDEDFYSALGQTAPASRLQQVAKTSLEA